MAEAEDTQPPAGQKKHYEKPALHVHGTLAELTQSGGRRRRDALLTRSPS